MFPPRTGPKPYPRPNLGFPPPAPTTNYFIQPDKYKFQNQFNYLRGTSSPPPFFANNAPNFNFLTPSFSRKSTLSPGPGNNLFGSQAAELTREKVKDGDFVTETKNDIDDTLYELPESTELELSDGLIENLGADAIYFFEVKNIFKQEEEDVVLERIKEEYGFEYIKCSFDEGHVQNSVCFFYGGDRKNFVRAV